MKTWLIVLPFVALSGVCLSGTVLAGETPQTEPAPATAPAKGAPAKVAPTTGLPGPKDVKSGHAPKHLPHGDIRRCLDKPTYIEVIRCSEQAKGR